MNTDKLIDYIRWRGDLGFEKSPFNLVDNVILCQLSYVDFSQVLYSCLGYGITLAQAFEQICEKDCFRLLTTIGGDDEFVRAAAESKRFGPLVLTYYTDVFDRNSTQFAALHFELSPTTSYVAFRGTDNSIIGWKEDFMTSFRSVPAQESAAAYLFETMDRNRDYYIGGHSKGGNLAVYAASRLCAADRRHILRIYTNDSPGFSPDVYDMEPINSLKPLITKLVPTYSVIGRLFQLETDDTRIVGSSASGILQHDLMTWTLKGPDFAYEDEYDAGAEVLHKAFDSWIKNADEEERKAFVEWLFDSLSVSGAVTIDDFKVTDVPDVLKSIFSPSREAKDVAMDFPKIFLTEAGKQVHSVFNEAVSSVKSQVEKKIPGSIKQE